MKSYRQFIQFVTMQKNTLVQCGQQSEPMQ